MWWTLPMLVLGLTLASCQDMVTTIAPGEPKEALLGSETPPLEKPKVKPTIRSLHITSDIKYRYATTLVSTRVVNPSNQSGEATFTVTLPESAFISEFLMEVKDKVYKAYVKEKEEAKAVYQQAVDAGQFAGHVALDARDSNQFTVSVNIESHGKVTFNLTYEQLLSRNLGVYSNVININPQQIVEDMSVIVNIEEPSNIIDLEVPELQLSNEAVPDKNNKYAKIDEKSPKHKQIIWAPTPEEQKSQNSTGLAGQFVVKYDVDRAENPQQILVDEGYFVHFFAPENLPKLRKHVVFVLDFSGSMGGRKLEQLKDAMKQIFYDLDPKDFFSIVIFESSVQVWSPTKIYLTGADMHWQREQISDRNETISETLDSKFVVEATPANIELARTFMQNYNDLGATNIMGGLRTGLQVVDVGEEQWLNESDPPQPVIVFLTDGQPNVEEYDPDIIIRKTKTLNKKEHPIFSLAFGYGADFNFLRKLSLQNFGFARNIYEAADATQQLKNFYRTIASPLLSNVTFTYLPGQVDNSTNTKKEFPVFFSGSELVVAGKVNQDNIADKKPIGELRGITASGLQTFPIIIDCINCIILKPENRSTGHLEKAWSYLTIQQLLDKADSLDNGEEKNQTRKKALDLALQYSFVTPLTSLVVVKPNETESAVDATQVKPGLSSPLASFGGGFPAMAYPQSMPLPPSAAYRPQASYSSATHTMTTGSSSGAGYNRNYLLKSSSPHRSTLQIFDSHQQDFDAPESMTSNADISMTDSIVTPHKIPLEEIKWLQMPLNSTDTNVKINVEGHDYKVGINETDSAFGDCQVDNNPGECHHLKFCALNIFQNEIDRFIPYKCLIPGDYLGVCCPRNLV